MTIRFRVNGEPRPKQSFRYSSRGGGYTHPRVTAWQGSVSFIALQAMDGCDPISGKLVVSLGFYLGNKRKVDLDNLSKAVLDAMNGIVYADDSDIIKLTITKQQYKQNPGVTIQIDKTPV